MSDNNYIVISLGGSIIVPNEVDIDFVKEFVAIIREYIKKGFNFVIITGGGNTCRRYNDSLKQIIHPTNEGLDWLGISATRLNAELIRLSFGNDSYGKVLLNPEQIPDTDKKVIIGGGWKPGNSSDLMAVRIAGGLQSKKVINLSNIDFAHSKDPKIFPDAEKIEKSSWVDFRSILPEVWTPGMNVPFDPIAAKEAQELNLEVVIMNGHNIENLKNYLNGEKFIGTIIK